MRWTLSLTLLALAGCGGESEGAPDGQKGGPPPARVKVESVRDGTLTDRRTFLGQVRALQTVELAAAVAGTVESIDLRPGDPVEAGQAVVELDRALVAPQLEGARADAARVRAELTQAERELARMEKLKHPVVTEAEKEKFRARAEVLKAQLRGARAQAKRLEAELARHAVRAPFTGVVRARLVEPGAWVTVGQRLLTLVSRDDVEIEVDVAQDLLPHLRAGGAAELIGPETLAAEIRGVVPALDPVTRTVRVRLAPASTPAWLIPGHAIDVRFAYEVRGDGVLVSRDALVQGPSGVRVAKLHDGKAVPVPVTVRAAADNTALVVGEGLKPGDRVVVRGNERLRPGQPVEIVED